MKDTPVRPQEYAPADWVPISELEQDQEGAGIFELLHALWRHRFVIALILISALIATYFYIESLRPLYTARAEVILEEKAAPIDLGDVLNNPANADKELQTELNVLEARAIMREVIERLDLLHDPEFNPTADPEDPAAWKLWLNEKGLWPIEIVSLWPLNIKVGELPEPIEFSDGDLELRGAIDRLQEKTRAGIVTGTTILWVSVEAWTAPKAALLANAIADAYINARLEAEIEAQRFASRFLGERVLELRKEVEAAEAAVQSFRSENTIVDDQDADVIRFEELQNRLNAARNLRQDHEARLDALERALASDDGLTEASRLLNNSRVAALAAGGDAERLEAAVARAVDQIRSDLSVARRREAALESTLAGLQQNLEDEAANLVRLRQLEREAEASKLLFETFLARQKETAARQDLITSDARILTQAEPPYLASSPKKRSIFLRAGIGALLLAFGIVYLLERSRNRFVNVEELEQGSGYPVLGSIPRFTKSRNRREVVDYVRARPGSALAEAVRNLRTSVLLANIDMPPQTVVVTSSVPGEGKSLTAILLATVTAQMGKKAIILDADLRRRTLHKTLQLKPVPGLISVLDGSVELEDAIKIEEKTGLHALMVENTRASAPDLLSSQAFVDLIEALKQRYDMVILDTPPVIPVTDARILAKLADTTLYIVKWNDTPRDVVRHGLASLRDMSADIGGLVLTQIDRKKQRRYGYGHYGNYGYGSYRYYRKADRYYTD